MRRRFGQNGALSVLVTPMHIKENTLNVRPPFDPLVEQIAAYVFEAQIESKEAYETARYCLMDTLGCALLALNYPVCTRLLGPVVPGTVVPLGSRVPGTHFELDPVTAAFNIGTLIRWLDFNDTWLASEWGHPSDLSLIHISEPTRLLSISY